MALVVFLRGINVGGHRTIRPTMLARQLKRYDVVNIGAAGTFVIRGPVSQSQLRVEFERRLPFQAEVIICRGSELRSAASVHPFGEAPTPTDVVRFVSVLSRRPRRNSRPRKQISLRPLPTPDADHTAPRHDGWTLRHAGHYPELEYHRRDREEPRSGELMSVPRLQHVSKPKCLCCASSAAPKSTGPSMPPPNPADAIRDALGNPERC